MSLYKNYRFIALDLRGYGDSTYNNKVKDIDILALDVK